MFPLCKLQQTLAANKFLKSIIILVTGTGFAHLITFLSLPLLTRFFTPDDFSLLAIYVAIVVIISSATSLRYEIAIPLPKLDKYALSLLKLSFYLAILISSSLFILVLIFSDTIISNTPLNKFSLYLVPIGVLCLALFNILQFWSTRKKNFTIISKTRITQSIFGNICQLVGGFLAIPNSLLLGQFLNNSAGVLKMASYLLKNSFRDLKKLNFNNLRFVAKKYVYYPKYSTPEVLANNAGIQLPIIIIATYLVGPEAGFLFLAMKIMQVPMALIGGSISQVFFAETAAEDQIKHKEITIKTVTGLFKTGVGPLIFIGLIADIIFPIIFGKDWSRTGEIIGWLTPWFIFQFIASPISMIMHVTNKQKKLLCLTVFGFIIRVGSIVTVLIMELPFVTEALSISGAVFYLVCFIVFFRSSGATHHDLFKIIPNTLKILALWLASGIIFRIILG